MHRPKVLVVDDSEIVRAMARDALEEQFEVFTAGSGIEANRYIFSATKPDVIVLDVMLPMLDGNHKAKLLKDNRHSCDIPVLLISSKPEDELRRLTFQSGANGFIRKPFTNQQIVEKIRDAIGAP